MLQWTIRWKQALCQKIYLWHMLWWVLCSGDPRGCIMDTCR